MNPNPEAEDGSLQALSERMHDEIADATSAARDVEAQLRAFVRDQPVVAVLAAAALGYVVARILAKR